MSGKNDISPQARAQQHINTALRKQGKDVPGALEIGNLIQDDLDAHFNAFKRANNMEDASMAELVSVYSDIMEYINGRSLTNEVTARLTEIAQQYGTQEVVAILDNMNLNVFALNVVSDEPELRVEWFIATA